MPLFWFVTFTHRMKRIRDKIFCFDIRLEPNLRTRHTTHIKWARCDFVESHGIHMSEFPPLLLKKRATTGSLSQNLFCQLQAKGEWLTILESLKKKTKKQTNKQRCSYELKMIYIYIYIYLCCPSGFLASNFSELYLSSISISTYSGEAFISG